MDMLVNPADVVMHPEFWIISVACIALLTAIKHAVSILREESVGCFDSPWVKALMSLANPILGGLLGALPGVFVDYPFPMQVLLGVVAGFLSPTVYNAVKNFMPNLFVTGTSDKRQAAAAKKRAE